MINQSIINITVLEPSQGMTLTNGETYSKKVYLGINDNPNNWYEIEDDLVPEDYKENNDDIKNK